ncbi:hypothetical protein GCM10028808_73020 [Spirosoma migulaei]
MENPFDSTVGLKGVTSPEPAVLVNNLTGITTQMVAALINPDNSSTAAIWASIKSQALDKLRNIIEGELTKSADFQYIRTRTGDLIGEASDSVIAASAVYAGYIVTAPIKATDELWLNSFAVNSASLTDVTTTIKVFSASGKELFSKTVTVKPDYNELSIGYGVRSQFGRSATVFVGIDTTNLPLTVQGTGQEWLGCDSSFDLASASASVAGPYAVVGLAHKTSTAFMLDAVIRRSLLDVIASYESRLQWAYANVCGSLLMGERRGSTNVNLFTNTLRDTVEELEAKFMDEAILLAKPIARDMLKELAVKNVVTDKADRPFDPGYRVDGFV